MCESCSKFTLNEIYLLKTLESKLNKIEKRLEHLENQNIPPKKKFEITHSMLEDTKI